MFEIGLRRVGTLFVPTARKPRWAQATCPPYDN